MIPALRLAVAILVVLGASEWHIAAADTFGSGPNQFDIEFVTIGNPGNPADTTGDPNPAGSVGHAYRIGKYEVSEDMIDKANALGGLGISKDARGINQPATSVSWIDAARFVNWLNTSTGGTPAYKFDGNGSFQLWTAGDAGYDASNLFRNRLAKYFLPSAHEWYKAAYYDPVAGSYYLHPTGSNSAPDGIDFPGDVVFDAVFDDSNGMPNMQPMQPNDVTNVGLLSPYGTAGQGGNAWEWEETEPDLVNDATSDVRTIRGGYWRGDKIFTRSTVRIGVSPVDVRVRDTGFRVASVPEPDAILLAALGTIALTSRRRAGA
jgi:formylglycine-generating enzyme required for sulfatase activity